MFSYKGAIVALVTPMKPNGDISWESLSSLINWQIESGIAGIGVVGTTGESSTIDVVEHIQLIEKAVEYANKRVPIIAGTGANSTKEAIYLTNAAKEAGADATLLVTPYYNKPTQEGLYSHYSSIADQVDIDQILYNVPARTACDLLPETVSKLSLHHNIIGLKEALPEIKRLNSLINCLAESNSPDFLLFSGDDASSANFILSGGHGTISVTANIVPHLVAAMANSAIDKTDEQEALKIHGILSSLNSALFLESNPIPVKWALNRMGKIESGIRLPLTKLNDKFTNILELALSDLKLIN